MRFLGFSIPVIVLIIGAYIIGAKYPALFHRASTAIGA